MPPCACSNFPAWSETAPVNDPFKCPKRADSISSDGIAAQFTSTSDDFARGLFNVAQGLREAPEAIAAFALGLLGLTGALGSTLLKGTFLGKMLVNIAKALLGMAKPALIVVGTLTALAKLLAKIGRDARALKELENLTDTVGKSMEDIAVALDDAFSRDPIDEETWEAFLENLPTATQDAVRKGIEEGSISADIAEQILNSPEIPDAIKDVLFDGLDKGAEGIIGTIADFKTDSGDLFRSAEMLEGLENDMLQPIIAQIRKVAELTLAKEKGTLRSVEELETQREILDVMLAIHEVGQQKRLATDKELKKLILEHVGGLMQMSAEERDLFRTEEGRLELAKKYAPYSEDLTRALKGQKKLQILLNLNKIIIRGKDCMKINELPSSKTSNKNRKRRGRGAGSGLGKTAGRGTKGTGARKTVPAYFEGGQIPLYRRIPKLKGLKNTPKMSYVVVNVSDLQEKNLKGDVDPDVLQQNGLTRKKGLVKVLGNGDITNTVNIKVHAVSESAKKKIEDAGGTVEVIEV